MKNIKLNLVVEPLVEIDANTLVELVAHNKAATQFTVPTSVLDYTDDGRALIPAVYNFGIVSLEFNRALYTSSCKIFSREVCEALSREDWKC